MKALSWGSIASVVAVATLAGCAAPQDVKTASTELTATIGNLDAAASTYGGRFDAELAKTAEDLRRAIVAHVVISRVRALSIDVTKGRPGLIELSDEVEAARSAALRLVDNTSAGSVDKAGKELDARQGVDAYFASVEAAHIENAADPSLSERARAELEAKAKKRRVPDDPVVRSYLVALYTVEASRRKTSTRLESLHNFVAVLRETHAILHAGVMTDVKPDGAALGDVVIKYKDVLLGPPPADPNGGVQ